MCENTAAVDDTKQEIISFKHQLNSVNKPKENYHPYPNIHKAVQHNRADKGWFIKVFDMLVLLQWGVPIPTIDWGVATGW